MAVEGSAFRRNHEERTPCAQPRPLFLQAVTRVRGNSRARVIKRRCFDNGDANEFAATTKIKPPHARYFPRNFDPAHHRKAVPYCGNHGRFRARSRSPARILQIVASRILRSVAASDFGFWPLHSKQPRGMIPAPLPRFAVPTGPCLRAPQWTACVKSRSGRREVGLRIKVLRH
jgi:hypothetical protein